jgi:DNA-binding ferritin-like protein
MEMAPVKETNDESVEAAKEMLAELVREKELLVARLNDLHKHIEGDQNLTSRMLRQVEWMEEKDRTVARLRKVGPCKPSFQPCERPGR